MNNHRSFKTNLYEQFALIGKALASPARLELLDLVGQNERKCGRPGAGSRPLGCERQPASSGTLPSRVGKGPSRTEIFILSPGGQRSFQDLAIDSRFCCREGGGSSTAGQLLPGQIRSVRGRQHHGAESAPGYRDVVLIDVRPELEYRAGHIRGALSVPVEKLATSLRTLPHDKEIGAYCRGPFCLFSHEAVLALKKKGFKACRLNCGLPDWRFAGLPVAAGQPK
jgi:rhodanese-related sulfurtransferase